MKKKLRKITCWKCGSVLHGPFDCGITATMIRDGISKPYMPQWKFYREQDMNWQFVKTKHGRFVQAGKFSIQLHWSGCATDAEMNKTLRLVAAAPEMRRRYKDLLNVAEEFNKLLSDLPLDRASVSKLAERMFEKRVRALHVRLANHQATLADKMKARSRE